MNEIVNRFLKIRVYSAFIPVLLLVELLLIPSSIFFVQASDKEIFSITIPKYQNGYNVDTHEDLERKIKSISYYLRIDYPAKDVIDFYSAKMRQLNYLPLENENIEPGIWVSYEDNTDQKLLKIKQYYQSWISEDKKNKGTLVLIYESDYREINKSELLVTFQLMPFYETSNIDKFFDELEKKGNFEEFMNLLKRYSLDNGNIDFKKAIKENPNNIDLQIYRDLIKESSFGE